MLGPGEGVGCRCCGESVSEISDIPEGVSTLRHYLLTLWRRKWLLIAPSVVLPLIVLLASARQAPLYEVTADVLVNRQEVAATSVIGQTPGAEDVGRAMDTNAQLARVPTVVERVLAAEGLTDRSVSGFIGKSSVYPLADVLRFTVNDSDSALAERLAGEYARQFVRYRRELDTAGFARTLRDLGTRLGELERTGRTRTPLYARLVDREQQLDSLLALRSSNVSVVGTPRPGDAEQVAPRPLRNAALAGVAGVVLGLVLAFLAETLGTKPRSGAEIEALLGVPLLARLARADATSRMPTPLGGPVADSFHGLRTAFELENTRVDARAILVTGIAAGSGRSTAAARLGVALARAGRRVTLVDLDLREGVLTRLFGLIDQPGVTSIVAGEARIADALVPIPLEPRPGHADAASTLAFLPTGALPAQPVEILSSTRLAATLAELTERSELVLLDTSPLLETPDVASLGLAVDAVLVVVGAANARRPALAEARRLLELWPAAKLGFALDERDGAEDTSQWSLPRSARPELTPVAVSEKAL